MLREWQPVEFYANLPHNIEGGGYYTSRAVEVRIIFIQPGGEFGIPPEFCILGIQFMRSLT